MSTDFHIGRRSSVDAAAFALRVGELVHDVLGLPSRPEVHLAVVGPEITGTRPAPARLEDLDPMLRVAVGGVSQTDVFYIKQKNRRGAEGTFLVSLYPHKSSVHVVLSALVAEALCELGGFYVDDEGYLSEKPVELACGELLEILRSSAKGRELVASAVQTLR